jgi:hypothetical protein
MTCVKRYEKLFDASIVADGEAERCLLRDLQRGSG